MVSQEEYNPDMLGTYLFYTASPPFIKDPGNMYVEKNVIDGKIGWKLPQEIFPANTNFKNVLLTFLIKKEILKNI